MFGAARLRRRERRGPQRVVVPTSVKTSATARRMAPMIQLNQLI
jgi:hypothetical protein